MSKYQDLRDLMGGQEDFNDTVVVGERRSLKWITSDCLELKERKALAAEIMQKLKAGGLTYVEKVVVRVWNASGRGSAFRDNDKICVYVDMQKLAAYNKA